MKIYNKDKMIFSGNVQEFATACQMDSKFVDDILSMKSGEMRVMTEDEEPNPGFQVNMIVRFKGDGKEYIISDISIDGEVELRTSDNTHFSVDIDDIIMPETPLIVYKVCSDFDGNDSFEIEVPVGDDPANEALAQLGWFIVANTPEEDSYGDECSGSCNKCQCCGG